MSKKILNKVKQWLKEEVKDNQDAEGLLNQIKKWEDEEEHGDMVKSDTELVRELQNDSKKHSKVQSFKTRPASFKQQALTAGPISCRINLERG